MTIKEKAERAAVGATLDTLLKYVDKNPKENLLKLITLGEKLLGGTFPQSSIEAARKAVDDGESNVYYKPEAVWYRLYGRFDNS